METCLDFGGLWVDSMCSAIEKPSYLRSHSNTTHISNDRASFEPVLHFPVMTFPSHVCSGSADKMYRTVIGISFSTRFFEAGLHEHIHIHIHSGTYSFRFHHRSTAMVSVEPVEQWWKLKFIFSMPCICTVPLVQGWKLKFIFYRDSGTHGSTGSSIVPLLLFLWCNARH